MSEKEGMVTEEDGSAGDNRGRGKWRKVRQTRGGEVSGGKWVRL